MIDAPDPGIYYDIPENEYHSWDCASYSSLKKIALSAEQYMYDRLNPSPQTKPMLIGSATDAYVLSPNIYHEKYFEFNQDIDKRTKAGKERLAEAYKQAGNKILLQPKDWMPIHEMNKTIYEHRIANKLLSSGESQVVIVWIDEETGVKCKARIDWINNHMKRLIDLKTTAPRHIDEFGKHSFNYGYYIQAAMYSEGARLAGIEFNSFNLIVVQSEAPYRVKVFHFNSESLIAGEWDFTRALYTWKTCETDGDWTDYQTDELLSIPEWYLRKEGIEID